ncbi:MAG TPA: hypothetical protein VGK24_19875 [Candidatus Angelobacter sp.]|jgi:hypothetical protein
MESPLMLLVWFVALVLAVLFFLAQMRPFKIYTVLKEIRDELLASRQVRQSSQESGTGVDPALNKIVIRRILDGS